MRELRLLRITEDRRHVVLCDDGTGEEFSVPADDSLRAVLRGDRVRLGQLETQMDSALRPRDIQARIRAGASPEEVADVAQIPVERIMSYAVPVLAEREHIVGRAQAASVRRKHTEGPTRALGDTISEHLLAGGGLPESARWDSRRREDGRWVVSVAPAGDDEPAHYIYDAVGRYVVAEDDAARRLIRDELPTEDPTTMAVAAAVQSSSTTGVPVDPPDWTAEEHAAPALASEDAPEDAAENAPDDRPTAGVTRLRRRRPLHHVPDPLPLEDLTSADASQEGEAGAPPAPRPEPRRRRDRRRASVPSWDEIMFGGKSE